MGAGPKSGSSTTVCEWPTGNADLARKRVDDCAEQARLRADKARRALSVLRDELQRLERAAAPRPTAAGT